MHNESMEFEFDPAKASSNLAKHSISFSHAEQALRDALGVTRGERTRIISARKASKNEARNYHA